MADFPYTMLPGNLKRFFSHIQAAGVPDKVTAQYLVKVGFKSTNDRPIIPVLKFIGFLDASGAPTNLWLSYRDKASAPKAASSAVREAYSDLFDTFPDAQRKDNEALRNYFSAHTKVGEKALGAIVGTFKSLCELGDFEGTPMAEVVVPAGVPHEGQVAFGAPEKRPGAPPSGPTININVQLQLPSTEDATVYEKLFSAMKKHLFPD